MSSIRNTTNFVGSTFVVSLYNFDKDKSTISFTLTNDNKYIFFLNFVSFSLNDQDSESYNVHVDLSLNACRKINTTMHCHSKTTWNNKVDALLQQSHFDGLFSILESNEKENKFCFVLFCFVLFCFVLFCFVLERLDKDGLYN